MSEVIRSEIEKKLLLINELLCDNTFFKLGCSYCNIHYFNQLVEFELAVFFKFDIPQLYKFVLHLASDAFAE